MKYLLAFLLLLSLNNAKAQNKSDSTKGRYWFWNHCVGELKAKDTLIISANLATCGEWGSHWEGLKITRKGKLYAVHYKVDSWRCNFDKAKKPGTDTTFQLDSVRSKIVQEFIDSLMKAPGPTLDNARNDYIVSFNQKGFHVGDVPTRWKEFERLIARLKDE